jgi:CheY-like chemotaxis protein
MSSLKEAQMTRKILLVEDNRDTVDMLQMMLDHMGYYCIAATNGKQGLIIAASQLPDLILLDITLPDMDGFAAARQIRQNPKTHSIPILATTGRASVKDQEECLQNGCNDYISKPFTPKQLVSRIEKLIV